MYVAGTENVLADALSRMYANDSAGTVRADSEYISYDVQTDNVVVVDMPLLAGMEAVVASVRRRREVQPAESGRPETSREFAARMKDRFVLRGPRKGAEGGNAVKTTSTESTTTGG